jgi:hypothetical protein
MCFSSCCFYSLPPAQFFFAIWFETYFSPSLPPLSLSIATFCFRLLYPSNSFSFVIV